MPVLQPLISIFNHSKQYTKGYIIELTEPTCIEVYQFQSGDATTTRLCSHACLCHSYFANQHLGNMYPIHLTSPAGWCHVISKVGNQKSNTFVLFCTINTDTVLAVIACHRPRVVVNVAAATIIAVIQP